MGKTIEKRISDIEKRVEEIEKIIINKMPTIKVSQEEYDLVVSAKRRIFFEGQRKIPSDLRVEKLTMGSVVGIGAGLLKKQL